jgi:hypothetical protein
LVPLLSLETSSEICFLRAGDKAEALIIIRRLGVRRDLTRRTRRAEARRVDTRRAALGDRRLVVRRLTGIFIFIEKEKNF